MAERKVLTLESIDRAVTAEAPATSISTRLNKNVRAVAEKRMTESGIPVLTTSASSRICPHGLTSLSVHLELSICEQQIASATT